MKRIQYFDILRIISTALVIWYHLVIQLANDGIVPQTVLSPLYSSANIHVATLAVSVFFMLSGACQMISSREDFRPGSYYKKRFLTLLIPFFTAYILYLIYTAFRNPETIVFFAHFPKNVSSSHFSAWTNGSVCTAFLRFRFASVNGSWDVLWCLPSCFRHFAC